MKKLSLALLAAFTFALVACPADPPPPVEQPKVEAPKKRTLARRVSDEGRGENDRRSDDEIIEAIRQTTEAVKARMDAFDARLLGKKKAA